MQIEGWKFEQLGSLGNKSKPSVKAGPFGSALKKEFYVKEGYKVYGQEQVIANDPFFGDYYIDEAKFKSLKSCEISSGDILISLVGTVGKVLLLPDNCEKGVINPRLLRISIDENILNGLYLKYFLESENVANTMLKWAQGGTMGVLNAETLKKLQIPIPPIQEQKKIAEILSTWDKAIATVEKLVANSQQQKKALMQQLLTGQKRLLDDNGVRFSDEWETYSFLQLGNTYTGLSGKNKEHFGKGKSYIPYMNIFKNSRIKLDNLELVDIAENENQNAVKYGDIFFTTSSETPEEVGMSSVLMQEIENVYLNSFCFGFRLNSFETLLPEFASHILRSQKIRKQISTLGQGATRYNLSKNQLMKLEIELPIIKEQEKIAQVLTLADQEIDIYQQQLDKLKLEKKALMQQLLTGQKRVKLET